MNERAIVLRYHEVALKGNNRRFFEEKLALNAKKLIESALDGEANSSVQTKQLFGRIVVQSPWNEATRAALSRVFGLSSFSPMRAVPTNLDHISMAAVEEFENYSNRFGMPASFRVLSRRSDKALPETSIDLDRIIGSAILEKFPAVKVDLEKPAFTVGVEVRNGNSFIWTEKIAGQGGLPVGSNGPVLCLISGGLDSPVAAIQMLRRGCPVRFVHFYGTPFVGEDALEKVEDLVRLVNRFQPEGGELYVIPFGKIQEKIALVTQPKMRTVLYRRMMIRVANELAKQIGAKTLVTGESVGQVASQTIDNLVTIDSVTDIPILRPLVTFDKLDIIAKAHEWGTFKTSVRPAADCCTLFADRHPSLRSSILDAEKQEKNFSVTELVQESLSGVILRDRLQ